MLFVTLEMWSIRPGYVPLNSLTYMCMQINRRVTHLPHLLLSYFPLFQETAGPSNSLPFSSSPPLNNNFACVIDVLVFIWGYLLYRISLGERRSSLAGPEQVRASTVLQFIPYIFKHKISNSWKFSVFPSLTFWADIVLVFFLNARLLSRLVDLITWSMAI